MLTESIKYLLKEEDFGPEPNDFYFIVEPRLFSYDYYVVAAMEAQAAKKRLFDFLETQSSVKSFVDIAKLNTSRHELKSPGENYQRI